MVKMKTVWLGGLVLHYHFLRVPPQPFRHPLSGPPCNPDDCDLPAVFCMSSHLLSCQVLERGVVELKPSAGVAPRQHALKR